MTEVDVEEQTRQTMREQFEKVVAYCIDEEIENLMVQARREFPKGGSFTFVLDVELWTKAKFWPMEKVEGEVAPSKSGWFR